MDIVSLIVDLHIVPHGVAQGVSTPNGDIFLLQQVGAMVAPADEMKIEINRGDP